MECSQKGTRRAHGRPSRGNNRGRVSRVNKNDRIRNRRSASNTLNSDPESQLESEAESEIDTAVPRLNNDREARFAVTGIMNQFEELKKQRARARRDLIRRGIIDDPDVPKPLSEAITMVGTCQDMCPLFEYMERSVQKTYDPPECNSSGEFDRHLAVKRFRRPAAGMEDPLPEDIRPPQTLVRTTDYLFGQVLPNWDMTTAHDFLWDRTRGIRQDFTRQHYKGAEAVDCFERIARFHIASMHVRAGEHGFSQQQEMEQFSKTLISLFEYYEVDCVHVNEAEFRAYELVLLSERSPDITEQENKFPENITKSPIFQRTIELLRLIRNQEDLSSRPIETFFNLVEDDGTPYLLACLLEAVKYEQVRKAGYRDLYKDMRRTYFKGTRYLTLELIGKMLHYNSINEVRRDCATYGLEVREGVTHTPILRDKRRERIDGETFARMEQGLVEGVPVGPYVHAEQNIRWNGKNLPTPTPFSSNRIDLKLKGRNLTQIINNEIVHNQFEGPIRAFESDDEYVVDGTDGTSEEYNKAEDSSDDEELGSHTEDNSRFIVPAPNKANTHGQESFAPPGPTDWLGEQADISDIVAKPISAGERLTVDLYCAFKPSVNWISPNESRPFASFAAVNSRQEVPKSAFAIPPQQAFSRSSIQQPSLKSAFTFTTHQPIAPAFAPSPTAQHLTSTGNIRSVFEQSSSAAPSSNSLFGRIAFPKETLAIEKAPFSDNAIFTPRPDWSSASQNSAWPPSSTQVLDTVPKQDQPVIISSWSSPFTSGPSLEKSPVSTTALQALQPLDTGKRTSTSQDNDLTKSAMGLSSLPAEAEKPAAARSSPGEYHASLPNVPTLETVSESQPYEEPQVTVQSPSPVQRKSFFEHVQSVVSGCIEENILFTHDELMNIIPEMVEYHGPKSYEKWFGPPQDLQQFIWGHIEKAVQSWGGHDKLVQELGESYGCGIDRTKNVLDTVLNTYVVVKAQEIYPDVKAELFHWEYSNRSTRKKAYTVFYEWHKKAQNRFKRKNGNKRRAMLLSSSTKENTRAPDWAPVVCPDPQYASYFQKQNDMAVSLAEIFQRRVEEAFGKADDSGETWRLVLYNGHVQDVGSRWWSKKFLEPSSQTMAMKKSKARFIAQIEDPTIEQTRDVGGLVYACSASYSMAKLARFEKDRVVLRRAIEQTLVHSRFSKVALSVVCYCSPIDDDPADPYGRDRHRTSGAGREARVAQIKKVLGFDKFNDKVVGRDVILIETVNDLDLKPAMSRLAEQVVTTLRHSSPSGKRKREVQKELPTPHSWISPQATPQPCPKRTYSSVPSVTQAAMQRTTNNHFKLQAMGLKSLNYDLSKYGREIGQPEKVINCRPALSPPAPSAVVQYCNELTRFITEKPYAKSIAQFELPDEDKAILEEFSRRETGGRSKKARLSL